jgi:hypothetical protein
MYALGIISSLADGNKTILGSSATYYSILREDDEIIVNSETVAVEKAYTNQKFTIKTALVSAVSGDMIYVEDKCIWLRYQIQRIEMQIVNYDMTMTGLDEVANGADKVKFNTRMSPLTELNRQKARYEQELAYCESLKSGNDAWLYRRLEYGTV